MIKQLRRALKLSWPLLIIVGIYLILVSLYIWVTPPFEGPDEPQHYAYIEWLVEQHDFPPQGRASWETPVQQESSQPPLYYLLSSVPARLVGVDNPRAEYRPNPHVLRDFPLTYPDNDNRAIHKPKDAKSLQGGWLALYLARCVTVIFGILLIVSVYGLLREVLPNQKQTAVMGAFLTATIPQVVFLSGLVSNDIPVAAMSTLTLWLLVALMRRGHSRSLALGVGIAFGLSTLLKASALALAVPIALAFIWMAIYRRRSWHAIFQLGSLIFLGSFLTAGWWFIRSWILFGSPLGLETHDQAPWAIDDPALVGEPRFRWFEVFRSFWIWLGWGTIRPSDAYYWFFFTMAIVALIGLLIAVVRRWKRPRRRPEVTVAIFMMLLSALFTTAVFLEIWMRRVTAPYGRLMYPVIAVIVLLLIVGWRAIHPKLPIIPLAITFLTAIVAPFWLLQPAYALPQFLDDQEIAENSSLNWYYGESQDRPLAELLSVTPIKQTLEPDSLLPVELCWRALHRVQEEYTVLVHIIGPGNSLISNRRTYPGLGRYPTSIWEPGTAWCDLIHILVTDQAVPRTLTYKIEVGILNPTLEDRLEVFSAAGESIGAPFAADVLILQDADNSMLSGTIDGEISLLDYEVEPNWSPNQENEFTLTWAISDTLAENYQIFVHLRDQDTGETVAQADGPPVDGWYPTSRWLPGTAIKDERRFDLPSSIDPGEFDLVVGFYNLETGKPFGHEFFIESIEIQQ